jgi:hypothetical protein
MIGTVLVAAIFNNVRQQYHYLILGDTELPHRQRPSEMLMGQFTRLTFRPLSFLNPPPTASIDTNLSLK